jgi:hypothetical protein
VSRSRWETNLDDLCRRLEEYGRANGLAVPDPAPDAAKRLGDSIYLAHSTADAPFAAICASGWLASAERQAADHKRPLSPTRTEVAMGTEDSVFFYVAPFRYPNTGCGLLFAATLESAHRDDGAATPFDSGWLTKLRVRPHLAETVRGFLARHELPVPEHRRYLGMSMDILFEKPEDYVDCTEPRWPGPIGLTEGDQRRWTHEVRIPDRVFVRGSHLQAVFAPSARAAEDGPIGRLFEWCIENSVDHIDFDAPREDDFEGLRRECRAYIRRTLY